MEPVQGYSDRIYSLNQYNYKIMERGFNMERELVLTKIKECGIVAVVRATSGDQARRIADACLEGGIAAVELTFTVPGAHHVIEDLAKAYESGDLILGAGTVLDPETARIAIMSGAQYVVSPHLDPDIMKLCNRYRIPCMPGVMTVRDAIQAMELGADILKLFPSEMFGPKMIKALSGPLPQARFMPTGGIDLNNIEDWVKSGAAAVGAAGSLIAGAKTGDYAAITTVARQFIEKIKAARLVK